jgi:hypothetical protein
MTSWPSCSVTGSPTSTQLSGLLREHFQRRRADAQDLGVEVRTTRSRSLDPVGSGQRERPYLPAASRWSSSVCVTRSVR